MVTRRGPARSRARSPRTRRLVAAGIGLLVDRALGEPPIKPHPVALVGRAMGAVERRLWSDTVAAGAIHAAIGVALGATIGTATRSTALATYVACAGRALGEAATDVERALSAGDLDGARRLLPSLVGRDPSQLDEVQICRAVVESVAENTVDAVVATGWWAAVAGAPGAAGHRVVNTMDAMVGHRTLRHGRYGTAAARLDDVAAWVPARVTALLVCCCRPRSARAVVRTVRRDAPAHPSPNGGVAEAAFAAALGLRLGGSNRYGDLVDVRPLLGCGRTPERQDIARAVALSRDVQVAMGLLLILGGVGASGRARWADDR